MLYLQTLLFGSIAFLIAIAVCAGVGIIAACLLIERLQAARRRRQDRRSHVAVATQQDSKPATERRAA